MNNILHKFPIPKKISVSGKLLAGGAFVGGLIYFLIENPADYLSVDTQTGIIFWILSVLFIYFQSFDGSYNLSKNNEILYELLRLFTFLSTALLIFGQKFPFYELNFWICLILWSVFYIVFTNHEYKNELNALSLINGLWSVSVIYISLGENVFSYAVTPMARVYNIHWLLDVRINLGAILLGIIIFSAIKRANETTKIFLRNLQPKKENSDGEDFIPMTKSKELINAYGGEWKTLGLGLKKFGYFFILEIISIAKDLKKYCINLLFFVGIFITEIVSFFIIWEMKDFLLIYLREDDYKKHSLVALAFTVLFGIALIALLFLINLFFTMRYVDNRIKRNHLMFNCKLSHQIKNILYLIPLISFVSLLFPLASLACKWHVFRLPGLFSVTFVVFIIFSYLAGDKIISLSFIRPSWGKIKTLRK